MSYKSIKTLTFLALLSTSLLQAQFEFGVKAGLNYDSLGDVDYTDLAATDLSADSKTGYHIGAYGKIDLLLFYLRPEIQFTKINSGFDNKSIGLSKIEAPILLGYKILGPLSVFAFPPPPVKHSQLLWGRISLSLKDIFRLFPSSVRGGP